MATTFQKLANNIHTNLASAYTAGNGSMSVLSTTGMPAVPFKISVGPLFAVYTVTAVSSTTLTVTVAEGFTDSSLPVNSDVWMFLTAGHYQDHSTAINNLENATPIAPGGSNTQLQYNNSNTFGGTSALTTASTNPFTVTYSTTDYTNSNGANGHIFLNNPNANGQTSVVSYINGKFVAKWRTDYVGNISWVANGGGHQFYIGGDVGSSTILSPLAINTNGSVSIGPDTTKVNSQNNAINPLLVTYNNVYPSIASNGINAHIMMDNPNQNGQTNLVSRINGSIAAKWRTDYVGNISWVAGTNGSHTFFVGGDFDTGFAPFNINNNSTVSITLKPAISFFVQSGSGQTADIQQFKNNSGTVLSGVDANGYMRSIVGSGTPSTSPPDGSMYLDNANSFFYVRVNGAWKKVAIS